MKAALWSYMRGLASGMVIAGVLAGCSTGGARDESGQPVEDVFGAFTKGEIRLHCELSCSGSKGTKSKRWTALYKQQAWRDLAIEVAELNFASDHEYFYLARSAEGLGFNQAAQTYYLLAKNAAHKCESYTCKDVDVAEEVDRGLDRVDAAIESHTLIALPAIEPISTPSPSTTPTSNALPSPNSGLGGRTEEQVTVTYMNDTGDTVYNLDYHFKSDHKGDAGGGVLSLAAAGQPGTMGYGLLVQIGYVSSQSYKYRTARDDSGKLLEYSPFVDEVISCKGSKCVRNEAARIPLPRSYLEARATTGLKIYLKGKGGAQSIEVPASVVTQFLGSVP